VPSVPEKTRCKQVLRGLLRHFHVDPHGDAVFGPGDESFAQRPWKAFQHVWQERYSAFLNSAKSKSSQSVKQ